jgi:nickel/cobalt transporter (NiCoT) family protein
MPSLSMAWLPLCFTVFALGLRHGLDADHLATIDGLTRFNSSVRPNLARWCGALFSAGHGTVVILVAVTMGAAATSWVIPDWARAFGDWISIGFLLALGAVNLMLVLRTPAGEIVRPAGMRSRLLSSLTRTSHPLGIAAIGSLFAVSFDTLSQALLFSATATRYGGWASALVLGLLFTLGMLCVDGLNGAWVAGLLKRADRRARIVSRTIGLLVALLSFAVAILGVVCYFNPRLDAVIETWAALAGILLVLAVALGCYMLEPEPPRHRAEPTTEAQGKIA